MNRYKILKISRVLCAVATLAMFSGAFLLPDLPLAKTPHLQFMPALIRNTSLLALTAIPAVVLVLLATLLFGRIYCSFICPLGTLQDIAIHLRNRIKPQKTNTHTVSHPRILRYSLLSFLVAAILAGFAAPLGLLGPFAIFGRIVTALVKPVYVFSNNFIVDYEWFDSLFPQDPPPFSSAMLAVAVISLVGIGIMAILKGRWFCGTLCPVGTLLGLISRFSWFKMRIENDLCVECGKCAAACKANCIDVETKTIDNELCVRCFNCAIVCPGGGVELTRLPAKEKLATDASKRDFLTICAATAAGAVALPPLLRAGKPKVSPVMPPGAMDFNRFTSKCTACQLCVSNCPNGVLKPASFEYGVGGFLQPKLDFNSSFCAFDCVTCSNVCPNGALVPVTPEKKVHLQIGMVDFQQARCVVVRQHTSCGACGEVCPTGAIRMAKWKNHLTIPKVNTPVCIGCGACENVCPATPKAMLVTGLKKHGIAIDPEPTPPASNHLKDVDFPF